MRAYLRQPGFSDSGVGIAASAELTAEWLHRIGCTDSRLVPTAGNPVVLGTIRSRRPGVKTLIIYGLHDLTPVGPDPWIVDPLAASIVPAGVLGLDPAPGNLLVTRGAHNHRGPVLSALLAIKVLLDADGDVPCNLCS